MDIRFACIHCNQVLVVDNAGEGLKVACPTCRQLLTIPSNVLAAPPLPDWSNYTWPPIDLLDLPPISTRKSDVREDLRLNAQILEATLREFGIDVQMGDVIKGPTITRYEVYRAPGVRIDEITNIRNDIALALKVEIVHILPRVPGKECVGIEVPNHTRTTIFLRDILETQEWRSGKARLPVPLGKDMMGNPIIADLAEMPHLLVAGVAGSGKSSFLNASILALLHHSSPQRLRFLMIDPKIGEMQCYNGLAHLMVPVVTDIKKVALALRYVINEMELRHLIFAKVGVRNIASFNARKHQPGKSELATTEKLSSGDSKPATCGRFKTGHLRWPVS